MKAKIIASFAVLAVMFAAAPVFAQTLNVGVTGTASATPAQIKARANATATAQVRPASTTGAVRAASSTQARVEMQQSVAKRKASHTGKILSATVERLEGIIARLESRMSKIRAEGGVTAESEKFVAEAKTHLGLAKAQIALFASVDLTSDTYRENFVKIRNIAVEAKMHIREAHKSLSNALRVLKGMSSARAKVNATSTASTTTQ